MNIKDCDFHDGKIIQISMFQDYVEILFEQWDTTRIKVIFEDYWRIKDNHSVGCDTGELLINSSKEIIDEAIKFNIDDGGTEEALIGVNSYSLTDNFGDLVLFEIATKNVRVEEV
ncbi:MAG: hypothetical protein FWE85_04215 [Clostridiales bacterium]|nr:hypothetical protein [Clostridiales bacterium]